MKISIQVLAELINCYDDNEMDHDYFLNIVTGEIVFNSSYMNETDHERKMEEVEEGFGEIYFKVPQTDSSEGYRDMEDFIETVSAKPIKDQLYGAIARNKGVFRRFKDVISENPDIQEQYYQFKYERNIDRVVDWLSSNNIDLIEK